MTKANESFLNVIQKSYLCEGPSIKLGLGMLDGNAVSGAMVRIPLKTLNRHGLIAGATGTGKTKTIQVLSERLSSSGVPVFVMDLKGDLSGLAIAGETSEKIDARHLLLGIQHQLQAYPVELLTISEQPGVRLRTTIQDFGPVLLAKLLEVNETQSGILSILFKYCEDNNLELIDLKDLKRVIKFSSEEGRDVIERDYGKLSRESLGSILRKIVELEQQGADMLFGEPKLNIDDLMRFDDQGKGMIYILRLMDIQDRPKLFSTFMLSLLTQLYRELPEIGDIERPKLALFIDEAHLIFKNASKPLLDKIESIIKLIRSKGVGIIFSTQNPGDIPAAVLSQLGFKIQHALRAFTAKDRKMIKLTAENYPASEFYDTDNLLVSLGVGEAAVTVLDEKGRPTALAATLLRAPESRMNILSDKEIIKLVARSGLARRYEKSIDRDSAYKSLNQQLEMQAAKIEPNSKDNMSKKAEPGALEKLSRNTLFRQLLNTALRGLIKILRASFKGK